MSTLIPDTLKVYHTRLQSKSLTTDHVAGDTIVTGAVKGNIGPNSGAPFPRPAYDSGWLSIDDDMTLTHNIGGNTDNYVVDMQFDHPDGIDPYVLDHHQSYYYFRPPTPGITEDFSYGGFWSNLSPTAIKIRWGENNFLNYKVRVRIWVYN